MSQYQAVQTQQGEPPLEWPYYGIGLGAAVKRFFMKYATFTGRASRGEYWWSYLFTAVVSLVLYGIAIAGIIAASATSSASGRTPTFGAGTYVFSSLFGLFALATLVPSLAITVRRLHDTGRSGYYIFFAFIPFVGGIILLVFLASATTPAAEQFGPPSAQLPPQGYGSPGSSAGYGQPYPGS